MKTLFYLGVLGLILFEAANVYFIMPMPGSQEMNSIDLAYFLHRWRWVFRCVFGVMIVAGAKSAFPGSKVFSLLALLGAGVIFYAANFKMAAEAMFLQPKVVLMKDASENEVDTTRIVLGVKYNGHAKAYPIQYIGYHHQVFDTIGDKPIIVTYCTVCRSGRIFEPVVNGKTERFRLVGMDHFNAMFEDKTTKSWWRQATGEAVAGPLKGRFLPELASTQTELKKWISLYPHTSIMQPDPSFQVKYDSLSNYEAGKRKGKLTRRDTLSWQDKSWIVGVKTGEHSKAYDWIQLEKERIIHDEIGGLPIAVVLAADNKSFAALRRTDKSQKFTFYNDTLTDGRNKYNLIGASYDPNAQDLEKINAYQEYWHSWRTFQPNTLRH
jgi:hypothetical protein